MHWKSVEISGPAAEVDVLVLTESGNVYRARRAWNGQTWMWAYWDRDAGLPLREVGPVTHWLPWPGTEEG